jgi:hypothetical protein
MALYVTPSSCPASPAESLEKPFLPASECRQSSRVGYYDSSIAGKQSGEHKISTTIGHYVRGFQGCQAVSNSINSFFFGIL